MKYIFLSLCFCLPLCAAAAKGKTGLTPLENTVGQLGGETYYNPDKDAIRNEVKKIFGVDDAALETLGARGLGYGEMAAVLALAKELPGGPTRENLVRICELRKGPPNLRWSAVAEKLAVSEELALKQVRLLQLALRAPKNAAAAGTPAGTVSAEGASAGGGQAVSGAARGAGRLFFEDGQKLMAAGDYAGAREKFKAAAEADLGAEAPLFNAGAAAYGAGDYRGAAGYWGKLAALRPDNWQAREALVQAWQAGGEPARRDAARGELLKLKLAAKDPELASAESFCRDRFRAGGRVVAAFEHFELKPPKGVIYRFLAGAGKEPDLVISLGSYERTTQTARALGEIGPGERLYHLDAYFGDAHQTLGMFKREPPSYEAVKELVVKYLKGELRALSGSGKQ